jgi:hypothetical protein
MFYKSSFAHSYNSLFLKLYCPTSIFIKLHIIIFSYILLVFHEWIFIESSFFKFRFVFRMCAVILRWIRCFSFFVNFSKRFEEIFPLSSKNAKLSISLLSENIFTDYRKVPAVSISCALQYTSALRYCRVVMKFPCSLSFKIE